MQCHLRMLAQVVGQPLPGDASLFVRVDHSQSPVNIDHDDICTSNINRQVHAINSTVGKFKVDVMAERVRQINPEALVFAQQELYTKETSERLLSKKYDFVVDAIDDGLIG